MSNKSINSLNIPINEEGLRKFGFKEQETVKTTFTISPNCDQDIRELANSKNMSIRECLDRLADVVKQAHEEEYLFPISPEDGKRVSYAISRTAKETFEYIAKERNVSRDEIVECAYLTLLFGTLKGSLTTQKKIHYLKIYNNVLDKVREISSSGEFQEALKCLENCGDEDIDDYFSNGSIRYIDSLTNFDLGGFIKKKEEEGKEGIDFQPLVKELTKIKPRTSIEILRTIEIFKAKDKANENNTTRE